MSDYGNGILLKEAERRKDEFERNFRLRMQRSTDRPKPSSAAETYEEFIILALRELSGRKELPEKHQRIIDFFEGDVGDAVTILTNRLNQLEESFLEQPVGLRNLVIDYSRMLKVGCDFQKLLNSSNLPFIPIQFITVGDLLKRLRAIAEASRATVQDCLPLTESEQKMPELPRIATDRSYLTLAEIEK